VRAAGHVLADQYAMARRVGFDEVEIDDDLARASPRSSGGRGATGARIGIRRGCAPDALARAGRAP
jgi:uncharacterized protein (DUF934 family)